MTRRDVLRLGAIGTGVFTLGALTRIGGRAVQENPSHALFA
jgi:hypothetical protein